MIENYGITKFTEFTEFFWWGGRGEVFNGIYGMDGIFWGEAKKPSPDSLRSFAAICPLLPFVFFVPFCGQFFLVGKWCWPDSLRSEERRERVFASGFRVGLRARR